MGLLEKGGVLAFCFRFVWGGWWKDPGRFRRSSSVTAYCLERAREPIVVLGTHTKRPKWNARACAGLCSFEDEFENGLGAICDIYVWVRYEQGARAHATRELLTLAIWHFPFRFTPFDGR